MNMLRKYEPFFVGLNDYFNRLDNAINMNGKYPPHNLVETDDGSKLEMALAGFSPEDVKVEISEGILTISSESKKEEGDSVGYHGIAKRSFSKSFKVSDRYEVTSASMKDGLLTIYMSKTKPDSKFIEVSIG